MDGAASPVGSQAEGPEADPRPVVALPRRGLSGPSIAAVAVVLALVLFLALNAQRRRAASASLVADRLQASPFASPPPLVVPPEPQPTPPVVTVVTRPAPPVMLPQRAPVQPFAPAPMAPATPSVVIAPQLPPLTAQPFERPTTRSPGPALVIDGGEEQGRTVTDQTETNRPTRNNNNGANGPGTGGDDAPARASIIANRTTVMPVGTIIPAVLETPIDTARPGLLRAVVSEDTRGFDGRRVLVPKGSRIIGEYQADVRPNQNRVLVTWNRLIRPDGVAIRLGSPASDPLGGAGVPGRLHTYFLQRFASAVLQSALQVGVNLASRPGNGSVIVGLPGTTVNTITGQGLLQANNLQPKITVKQGAAVNVFVARDLDFSGVPSRP